MLFNMYIYNRRGKCLYYKEWNRPLNTLKDDPDEERKLVYGMLFSLKDLASKLSPHTQSEGLHTVKTNSYTLHHFQSLTGMVFVVNSTPDVNDLFQALQYIYTQIFVEFVIRNPLYRHTPDEPINCPLFVTKMEEYLQAHVGIK